MITKKLFKKKHSILTKHLVTEYWFYLYFLAFYKPSKNTKYIFILVSLIYLTSTNTTLNAGLVSTLSVKHPILLFIFILSRTKDFSTMLLPGILALLLGSWWASSEFNWGGWWSFDFVENNLLLSVSYCAFILHTHVRVREIYCSVFLRAFFFFFLLKFSTIVSIHSFITNTPNYYFWCFLFSYIVVSPVSVPKIYILSCTYIYLLYTYITVLVLMILLIYPFIKTTNSKPKQHWFYGASLLTLSLIKCLWVNTITHVTYTNPATRISQSTSSLGVLTEFGVSAWVCIGVNLRLLIKPINNLFGGGLVNSYYHYLLL